MSEVTPEQAMASLDLPTRVYVLAVRDAEFRYRRTVAEAWRVRQAAIDEALEACEVAMREEASR